MGELANCPRCGGLFVKHARTVCDQCFKEEEAAFDKVNQFIRKKDNRTASIPEVVAATDVEEHLVIKFVKENRLRSAMFPNLTYPCQKCGADIREGKLCGSCAGQIQSDLEQDKKLEQLQQGQNDEERRGSHTYYSINKDKK